MAIQVFPGQGGMQVRSFPQGYGPPIAPRQYMAPQQQMFAPQAVAPGGFSGGGPGGVSPGGMTGPGPVNPGTMARGPGAYDPGGMSFAPPNRGNAVPLSSGVQPVTY